MAKRTIPDTQINLNDYPVKWMVDLVIAHDEGDYEAVQQATRELERLGWCVTRRTRRRRQQAKQKEV